MEPTVAASEPPTKKQKANSSVAISRLRSREQLRVSKGISKLRPGNMPISEVPCQLADEVNEAKESSLCQEGRIYEYTSAANPAMKNIPVMFHPAEQHQSGPTRVIPFDLSKNIGVPYPASSPNLMASFLRICKGEQLGTTARATSQAFYVITGKGCSQSESHGSIPWAMGDMVVLPRCPSEVQHTSDASVDSALYWVTDEPLLRYLGVSPTEEIFKPTVIRREQMLREVERISHEEGSEHRNRMGILLGTRATEGPSCAPYFPMRKPFSPGGAAAEAGAEVEGKAEEEVEGSGTLTLTPTLWSLLNVLPAHDHQQPHRHNSVALDLAVYAAPSGGVYTLMGPELDETGTRVKDPIRCDWATGAVFLTPPGWWHSHHNESDEKAWVLPMQDAGLFTYQRTLDIRFAPAMAEATPVAVQPKGAAADEIAAGKATVALNADGVVAEPSEVPVELETCG
mmetsp:Transcript_45859/g.127275  ORF Transcript_45859/g.127275 Transcript_45859/m.127275 type:complete len:456 (-) Transcript_45859:389-1756(-)